MSTSTVSAAQPQKSSFERRVEDVKPSKTDINAIIMDYFVSEGYPQAAQMLAREANIKPVPSPEEIQERRAIRLAIDSGNIQMAIERINELNPQILDEKPTLHFSLLRLQLIELIKSCTSDPARDITPALDFATQNLAPRAPTDPAFLQDLERTMALLIFPAASLDTNPQLAPLLRSGLRTEVWFKVNEAISESLGRRREAKIRDLVRCRAWAERERRAGLGKGQLPERISLGLDDPGDAQDANMGERAEDGEREDREDDDDDDEHGAGDLDPMIH